jgi:hypothetical protein
MADFTNIYDIYNQMIELDKPYVDSCIDAIKLQISDAIDDVEIEEYAFDFDFDNTSIKDLPAIQKDRIKGRVQYYMRAIGVQFYSLSNSYIYHVGWLKNNRNPSEFMKAYV